ncbi:ABC transporter permease [Halobacteriales archaeon QS_1_69_70]|nr:MAG: ABC transporter permease [Halobacteriales archaeon QS_1_69_70]
MNPDRPAGRSRGASYRRALLFRWSREDRLAVVVIAVTVAFLVGTVLFVVAAGDQTAAIAAGLESPGSATYYGSTAAAEAAAGPGAVVVAVTEVTGPDGAATRAVAVPRGTDRTYGQRRLAAGGPTLGAIDGPGTHRVTGETAVTLDVEPRRDSILPPSWYAVTPETMTALGPSGAIVVEEGGGEVPLRGVVRFFAAGTGQLLGVVGLVAAGGGLLVGITAFSTTRIAVADRRDAIRVLRATGATPRTVLGLFGCRAALLGGVGVALGYAVGVIAANAAVNAATALGVPTSLSVDLTARTAGIVIGMLVTMVAVATVGGVLAARRAATVPPARIDGADAADGPLSLAVLDARALVPTAATLSAFLLVSSVVVAGGAALAPVTATDRATISEPGAGHPVASQVPAGYADALRARGVDASGEILLFGVRDGNPLPMRGVDYGDYAAVTGATIVEGRRPRGPDEAVAGANLDADLDVGDTVTIGGSTRAALARVRVVGRYDAPGAEGGALLVSLPTARHLSSVRDGRVNVVRADRLPAPSGDGLVVTSIRPADDPVAGEPVDVEVALSNADPTETNGTLGVAFGDQRRDLDVGLSPGETTRRTVEFRPVSAGTYDLETAGVSRRVSVQRRDQLSIQGAPATAPPGSRPLVTVVDATGAPGHDVAVRVEHAVRRTDRNGTVRVPLSTTGTREVVAGDGPTAARTTVDVRANATRRPTAALAVRPDDPDVLVRPTATLSVRNPWNGTLAAEAAIGGPTGDTTRTLRVPPGERRTVTRRLARRPPGEYTVTARVDGRPIAERNYTVTGDERIPAAVAAGGRTSASPVGDAVRVAFGDLRLMAAALVGLAALMTVGATTATFAAAVRARRRALGINRATGAPPRRIARLVVGDALRVGVVATAVAAVVAGLGLLALDRAGRLTVYGVRLLPALDPVVAAGVALAALVVVAVSAGLATVALVRATPADLVRDRRGGPG